METTNTDKNQATLAAMLDNLELTAAAARRKNQRHALAGLQALRKRTAWQTYQMRSLQRKLGIVA